MLEEEPKAFKDVKKAAFLTLNAIVHHDGQDMLIPSSLSSVVLPALYAHMDFKEVHEVDLGPFKHKVDEGLPLRKGAFACMDTILDRHNDRVDIGEFLPKLIFGLGDKEDVCMLCHQILSKLCRTRGAVVLGAVADLTVPLGKTVNKKVKDGQAGTQMERRNDVIRSALRAIDSIQRIPDAHSSRSFEDFISTIMKKDHIRKMLAVVRSERGDSVLDLQQKQESDSSILCVSRPLLFQTNERTNKQNKRTNKQKNKQTNIQPDKQLLTTNKRKIKKKTI